MRRSILLTAGPIIFLAGYAVAIIYELIPRWLFITLAPFVILSAILALVMLGGYAILLVESMSDFLRRNKEKFLLKYGVETQAVLIEAELYHGPGLHKADPCYRGVYRFTDLRGREHSFGFSRECYDPYDLNSLEKSIEEYYKQGAERRVLYWRWFPFVHCLYGPDVDIPQLRGRFGLYRMQ